MDSFIGTVMAVAFNFEPEGWDMCNGQSLPVNQNQALYSLIGNVFGGNYVNFNLPDLRGRTIIGMGQGTNQPNYSMGQNGGSASALLNLNNLPPHTHSVPAPVINVSAQAATQSKPGAAGAHTLGAAVGDSTKTQVDIYVEDAQPAVALVTGAAAIVTGATGNSTPVSVMQPYLALNYIICVTGLYPPRK